MVYFASTPFANGGQAGKSGPLFRRKQLLLFPTQFDRRNASEVTNIRSGAELSSPSYPKRRIGGCFTRPSDKSHYRAMAAHRAEWEREG